MLSRKLSSYEQELSAAETTARKVILYSSLNMFTSILLGFYSIRPPVGITKGLLSDE
jgi:hypothetical protein